MIINNKEVKPKEVDMRKLYQSFYFFFAHVKSLVVLLFVFLQVQASNAQSFPDSIIHKVILTANTANIPANSSFKNKLNTYFAKIFCSFFWVLNRNLLLNNVNSYTKVFQNRRNKTLCFFCFNSIKKQKQNGTIPVNNVTTMGSQEQSLVENASHSDMQTAIVPVIADKEYKAGGFKATLLGKHYRDIWTTTVLVPYLNADTTCNSLIATKQGGGRQIKKSAVGNEHVFRSVNKDSSKALNYELRETIIARALPDQTTTQHPYGPVAVDIILNELNILTAHPRLFVLPDNKRMGGFQKEYVNMVGILEERPSVPNGKVTDFAGGQKL